MKTHKKPNTGLNIRQKQTKKKKATRIDKVIPSDSDAAEFLEGSHRNNLSGLSIRNGLQSSHSSS